MNEKDAINILTQAVMVGQKNGIYSIKDAALIFQALNILNPEFFKEPEENPEEK